MYYSASSEHLADANINEPAFIGVATASFIDGPWKRQANGGGKSSVKIRGGEIPHHRVLGIGSLKLIRPHWKHPDKLYALCNRLMIDLRTNHTTSRIGSVIPKNEEEWVIDNPSFITPTYTTNSWNQDYVYGFDTLPNPYDDNQVLIYYNARKGHRFGYESIGVALFQRK